MQPLTLIPIKTFKSSLLLFLLFCNSFLKICDEGGISVLQKVLESSSKDKELIACCNALWLLCFCKKGALLIDENEELKTLLSDLKVSKCMESLTVNCSQGSYSQGKSGTILRFLRKVRESQGESGTFFYSLEKSMFS